jgi:Arc/MetJ-type ribon-helix-helix transcriptional regulator
MASITQKKFSITADQSRFLENYQKWGYSDQSSIVREALNRLIREFLRNQRKIQMVRKARELLADYEADQKLTAFTALDGEVFL